MGNLVMSTSVLHLLWPDRKSSIGTGHYCRGGCLVSCWSLLPLRSHWAGLKLKGEGTVSTNRVSLSVFFQEKKIVTISFLQCFISRPNIKRGQVYVACCLLFARQIQLPGLRSLSGTISQKDHQSGLVGRSEVDWSPSTDHRTGDSSVFGCSWRS